MYEQIMISKILDLRDTSMLSEQGLHPEMFLNTQAELNFILAHENKYKCVPDHATFIAEFPDFELYSSNEDIGFISEKIKDNFLYPKLYKVIQDSANSLTTSSIDTLKHIEDAITDIKSHVNINTKRGTDIVSTAKDRYLEVEARSKVDGLLGITTGIQLLDDITYGWLPNDYAILFARTNQGKSWLSIFFGVKAWESGKKVVYYSGEMDKFTVGMRFDNLYKHFKNAELMTGKIDLEEYNNYTSDLSNKSGFIVVEPSDFGGFPTVSDLEGVMKYHNADILIIDQLSLMKSKVQGSKTERYGNISSELVFLQRKLKKHILLIAQASRNSEKNKKEDMDTPELTDIEYSDSLGQDSSKVFSFTEVDNIIKLSIKKSRFGSKNRDILLAWDKDQGYIRPLFNDGNTSSEEYGF